MRRLRLTAICTALLSISSLACAADTATCMNCHDDDEFSGMNAADILADLQDPGIRQHQRFADISDEELKAIAAELAGG
jgi:Spy/CpxP family protein refolding chaperone